MRFDEAHFHDADDKEDGENEVDGARFNDQETFPHVHTNPMQNGGVAPPDYPQNPYGDRETRSESLYFADGERSIDFVLCWKKLLPGDDDTSAKGIAEAKEVERKETERTEKREIFEQNLVNEGLEIERVTVDDEINFVKIHAPLEVLRRYAEILKLRLPMKEVSQQFL
jgi:Dimerisation domain of Ca+-activated chloride-channel, anoctamin